MSPKKPQIYPIITDPNPILRKKSVDLDFATMPKRETETLCQEMTATMLESDGVGLAAPQIGKNIRVVTINTADGPVCMINPKITGKSILKEWGEEGCLSVPDVFGQVKRHKKISCQYFTSDKKKISIKAEGLFARVIQHELDHLDGVLFIDKMRKPKK
jgi:peptide deformylase